MHLLNFATSLRAASFFYLAFSHIFTRSSFSRPAIIMYSRFSHSYFLSPVSLFSWRNRDFLVHRICDQSSNDRHQLVVGCRMERCLLCRNVTTALHHQRGVSKRHCEKLQFATNCNCYSHHGIRYQCDRVDTVVILLLRHAASEAITSYWHCV